MTETQINVVLTKGLVKFGFDLDVWGDAVVIGNVSKHGVGAGLLKPGDRIIAINDHNVVSSNPHAVAAILRQAPTGPLIVKIARWGSTTAEASEDTNIPVGDQKPGMIRANTIIATSGKFDFELDYNPAFHRKHRVISTSSSMPKLKIGDALTAINGIRCDTMPPNLLESMIGLFAKGDKVSLVFVREPHIQPTIRQPDLTTLLDLRPQKLLFRTRGLDDLGFTAGIQVFRHKIEDWPKVEVIHVTEGTPASQAGLQRRHVLLAANNVPLIGLSKDDLSDVMAWLQRTRSICLLVGSPPGTAIIGEEVVLRKQGGTFGLSLTDRLPQLYTEHGCFIEQRSPTLYGDNVDALQPNMMITEINGVSCLNYSYQKCLRIFRTSTGSIRLRVTQVTWATENEPSGSVADQMPGLATQPVNDTQKLNQSSDSDELPAPPQRPSVSAQAALEEESFDASRLAANIKDVTLIKDSLGLGFGIQQRTRLAGNYIHVGNVSSSGPAADDLQEGDILLWANGTSLADTTQAEAADVLKATVDRARMLVVRHFRYTSSFKTIRVTRSSESFGISIAGGHETTKGCIYVRALREGSSVQTEGLLHVGDRILAVNGTLLLAASHDAAVDAFRTAPPKIDMLIERPFATSNSTLQKPQVDRQVAPAAQASEVVPPRPPPRPRKSASDLHDAINKMTTFSSTVL
eukprot:TRINITY_DN5814_c0_g1_i1.p1 TRINITY_DN5814_c0_g1~~TRINITY_DN5814_c0_g1_i1.p1  ORF type:complete len:689 (+),score=128.75 TRINITY_DN5814_c0_g1_i1:204-2270(+)